MVCIKLLEEDRQFIEKIAKRYDITMSDVVRMAIREFLERRGG
jgi:Arc/MetJ-type ribon-helix-helix transcriptional regulator